MTQRFKLGPGMLGVVPGRAHVHGYSGRCPMSPLASSPCHRTPRTRLPLEPVQLWSLLSRSVGRDHVPCARMCIMDLRMCIMCSPQVDQGPAFWASLHEGPACRRTLSNESTRKRSCELVRSVYLCVSVGLPGCHPPNVLVQAALAFHCLRFPTRFLKDALAAACWGGQRML